MRSIFLAVALVSTLFSASADARRHAYSQSEYYTATSGHHVHRPVQANRPPVGASAQCGDRSYSFSENHRGTCSHHGGVSRWL